MQKVSFAQFAWWFVRHAFIIATGFTALLHSTWALATIFNGLEPKQLSLDWFAWVIPAFAFAFSIDVGQIATSVDIRNGERTPAKYVTFAVLAIATYYLQWWYIAAHIPMVALSQGVANSYLSSATFLRDLALWIVPGLLPASTLFYTLSYAKPRRNAQQSLKVAPVTKPANSSANGAIARANLEMQIEQPKTRALPEPVSMTAVYLAKCPDCDWSKPCETERSKINSLNAHKSHCPAKIPK